MRIRLIVIFSACFSITACYNMSPKPISDFENGSLDLSTLLKISNTPNKILTPQEIEDGVKRANLNYQTCLTYVAKNIYLLNPDITKRWLKERSFQECLRHEDMAVAYSVLSGNAASNIYLSEQQALDSLQRAYERTPRVTLNKTIREKASYMLDIWMSEIPGINP